MVIHDPFEVPPLHFRPQEISFKNGQFPGKPDSLDQEGAPTMNLRKAFLLMILLQVMAVPKPLISNLDNQDKAPAVSSPQVTMHENGDRESHYPPYYHPEASGRR
jgi:hypothetical protein